MDFSIIDPHTNELFQQIRSRIRRLQSGGTIDSLQDIGANTEKQIGASYLSLKELASSYTPQEKLALLLWQQARREEQIVACLLFPSDLNKEKITQLAPLCMNSEIASYLGSLYLFKRPDLKELADEWLNGENPFLQTAILTALAKYFILNKENGRIPKDYFQAAVHKNYKDKFVQLIAERYRFNI